MKLYSGKPEKAKTKHVFKNNDYYASVCAFREGHTITAEHRALMNSGKAERKARRLPHSVAKRITFKKNSRRIDPKKTPGTPYFLTLKPLGDMEPEYFNEAMTGLIKRLRTASAEYIYALEWAEHERMPHIHLVANIPGNTPAEVEAFAEGVIRYWLKKTPKNPNTRIKQDARPVYDAHGLFNYMSKQTPDEFNARAIATGKDWSVISVTGCSRGWKESKSDTTEVSRETGSAIKREMKKIALSRGISLKKRSKGCDAETKRSISEVSPFTVSGLTRTESERLLINTEDSQPLKERQFIVKMRDLYRKAHELGSQEVKDEVERLLLDKGYDMRHMFSEWEKPQMNRVERCGTDPLFRRLCKDRKRRKAVSRKSSVTVIL
ncbi:TPA: hypothetical protein OZS84_004940 [Escherichia coli]|uniref:hypothetical protein n=1 Tax=Klebsiella pneumoniae TaxID=573 RepID=UPI0004996ACE|nr:hypothetical protein [Klebsiella pneumoniae]HCX4720642.1 hypothetical protein [Escherichia coli]AIA44408.1 hypothetical protein KPNIH27_24615 [Klebsiella pneumoniae subsp. pneumoniae KPNIH27]MDU7336160.1 hypothetical protein [Klebsiella pneumoniae]HBR0862342.1 hypothetical protein [Klebsiella pneumoniae]HBS2789431.1 hypothetical protein [Klebsiella pneumoniae]